MKSKLQAFKVSCRTQAAFTIVELLAVIATIALLVIMLLPALAGTKTNSQSFQCMNNLRQLTIGWRMYADDNADKVANNFAVTSTLSEIANSTFQNWVNNVMTWGVTGPTANSVTNISYVRNGRMFPYVNSATIYRCPADVYVSAPQRAAGWTSRMRSISMNAYFGPTSANPADLWAQGRNQLNTTQRQWLKFSEVLRPANYFVMIEEHADSISAGWFHNPPIPTTQWDNLAASYHAGACNLTFVDGHAETHKWRSSRTIVPVSSGAGGKLNVNYNTPTFDQQAKDDLEWIQTRSSVPF